MDANQYIRQTPTPDEFPGNTFCCKYQDKEHVGPHGHVFGWERLRTALAAASQQGALSERIINFAEIDYTLPMRLDQQIVCPVSAQRVEVAVDLHGEFPEPPCFRRLGHVKFLTRAAGPKEQKTSNDTLVRLFEELDSYGGFAAFVLLVKGKPDVSPSIRALVDKIEDLPKVYQQFKLSGGFRRHVGGLPSPGALPRFATRHAKVTFNRFTPKNAQLSAGRSSAQLRISETSGLARVTINVAVEEEQGPELARAELIFAELPPEK